MADSRNILLGDKSPQEVLGSVRTKIIRNSSKAPLSPKSGMPMVAAKCGNIPVWADLENRVVFPVEKK